jgi:hypothetical protein
MERAGLRHAAADRRRDHLEGAHRVKIEPAQAGPTVYVTDASRSVGVVLQLLSKTQRERYVADLASRVRAGARAQRASGQTTQVHALEPGPTRPIDWALHSLPKPDWSAYAAGTAPASGMETVIDRHHRRLAAGRWWTTSTGRRSSTPGSWPASTRPSSTTRSSARRPRSSSPTPGPCSTASSRSAGSRALRLRLLPGPPQSARRHRQVYSDESAARGPRDAAHAAPADGEAPAAAQPLPRGLRGPGGRASPTGSAPSRSPPASASTSTWRFEADPRRLQLDHAQGPGRPPGRGLRRAPAPAVRTGSGATRPTSSSTTTP